MRGSSLIKQNVDNPQTINVLSLCAGYGGLELGLSRALETVFRVVAVEIEAYALANLVAKAEEGKLAIEALYPDVKTFPAERFSGCFDIITAGYPCQPFSVAGKRAGEDNPRHLWPHIARIVQAVKPVWCFFENVPGHLTLGFPAVYRSLRDMGYSVEAGLFTAAEVGAPHKRERLFILANRERKQGRLYAKKRGGNTKTRPTSETMADTKEQGLQGQEPARTTQTGRCPDEHGGSRWPARPGQPQYEWEEPRVVVAQSSSPAVQEPGVKAERLEGELGSRMYDKETGRLAQYSLTQQVEKSWPTPSKGSDGGGQGIGMAGGNGNRAKLRRIMGEDVSSKLNPAWVESLMGLPCNWTNALYNGSKNKGDSHGNPDKTTEKGVPILRTSNGTQAIQGTIGGFPNIQKAEILQPAMSCLCENATGTEQGSGKEASGCDKNGEMRKLPEHEKPPTPSRRLQSATTSNSTLPDVSCSPARSKQNMGGYASVRVDRLRLLGNGVVPQQAERAFRTLMEAK